MDVQSLKLLFRVIVRPHQEYGNVIWQPPVTEREKANAYKVENVLRRATRMVPELRHLPYEERLAKIGLPSLWYRQQRADVIETWKLTNDHYNLSVPIHRRVGDACQGGQRPVTRKATNGLVKMAPPNGNKKRGHFFSYRVVNLWNSLPDKVTTAPSLNSFKNGVDKTWRDKAYRSPFGPFALWSVFE